MLGEVWGLPPALDLKQEAALQKCLQELIADQEIESAHDCSEGGLAVALAEAAFVSGVGAEINLTSNGSFPEALLFGEDASRVVISCDPNKTEIIQEIAIKWGIRAARIGRTVPEHLKIAIDGNQAVMASVSELRQVWDVALTQALEIG
jgi:phosphoribosylformylglycinamidine synthase